MKTGEREIQFILNGRDVSLGIQPHEMLLQVLRRRLGLMGTKKSCDVQVCGSCTVLVDGMMVSACTYLAYEVSGRSVETVEGLAAGEQLHPIQEAFLEENGFQCGYCTPGMILATKALLAENPAPTVGEIQQYMHGNICRCTGYQKVIDAVLTAAKKLSETEEPA